MKIAVAGTGLRHVIKTETDIHEECMFESKWFRGYTLNIQINAHAAQLLQQATYNDRRQNAPIIHHHVQGFTLDAFHGQVPGSICLQQLQRSCNIRVFQARFQAGGFHEEPYLAVILHGGRAQTAQQHLAAHIFLRGGIGHRINILRKHSRKNILLGNYARKAVCGIRHSVQ